MPDFEFEFNQQDRDLIVNQEIGNFKDSDYMRIIVYPTEAINNIVDLPDTTRGIDGKAIFFATLSENNILIDVAPFKENNQPFTKVINSSIALVEGDYGSDFKIHVNENTFGDIPRDIYIKPNEIFNKYGLPQGNYKLQIDFLNQLSPKQLPLPYWFEEFDIEESGNSLNNLDLQDSIKWVAEGRADIGAYISQFSTGQLPIPPKFSDVNVEQQGDLEGLPQYRGVDYYKASNFVDSQSQNSFDFLIKQISTSRKEVRLKLRFDDLLQNSSIIQDIKNQFNNNIVTIEGTNVNETNPELIIDNDELSLTFGQQIKNPNYKYQFKHLLNIGNGNHIPILNYQFDELTDGKNNQSLILKLYEPLPTNITNLKQVTIEKEIITTQVEDIFYFSDVPDVFFGDGLVPQPSENWINPNNNEHGFQSIDEIAISQSIGEIEVDGLISSSEYGYPNLNTDFTKFENHTFFGSAKKKLENFKTKVTTIQGYYTDISSSLSVSSSINGDSLFIINKRQDLFNKINEEFKTFTPYEKFLFFDGQSESSASAPSLKNYADTIPVQLAGEQVEGVELNQHNGFNVVYKHTSEKILGTHNEFIDLFTGKYKVENKPFFNYSGSIYLSFLLQGDSGSSLTWENVNKNQNPPLPQDTLYQNNVLNPQITGSAYQRYIFEASQSYFVPNNNNNDLANLTQSDFEVGSNKIIILSGSVKTGSQQIKDSVGTYPTTVITQSGVPFFGSVMPSGELFKIFYKNTLSSSLLGYYDYVDADIVTGGNDFEILDKSGNNNTLQFGGQGVSPDAFTSSSIVTGVQGGDAFAFSFTGSEAAAQSGSMHLSTNGSTAPIETAPISMSAVEGDDVTGFTMATFYKSTSPKTNTTILSMDIKSGSTDVHGWNIQRLGDSIAGEVTREGVNIIDATTADDGLRTGTLTPRDGNFHHIAMTYDNLTGTGSLFFDGVLQNQGNARGFVTGSNQIYRLIVNTGPGSAQGFDDAIFDETRFYTRALTPSEINQLFLHPDGKTETKITDVKLTLKDPTDVLPFDNIFKTTSTEFTNWYNNALTEAETFDTNNIHSFENNLPEYIRKSTDYNDMKDFLNLQGEQYDLIRNHIDSMTTIHKRGYKKNNSPPNNTLPMLLSNMGFNAINPFSGSLTETLGSYLSGVTSIDDIKSNTWRKTLNNLIYIYKSKGTKNSVNSLLNVYGYPPDVLQFQEFGGTTSEGDSQTLISDIPTPTSNFIDFDLANTTGSYSFTSNKQILYRYNFNTIEDRKLGLQWWMDDANINTIQFVYKHVNTTNTQTILKSSGSGAETLWDLRLVPSSDGASSSFQFRLNNSQIADTDIGSRGFSMSLAFDQMKDGQLWNVMLQRMTGSTNGTGEIEYRLHSALQEKTKIKNYNYISMSISGGLEGGSTLGGKGFFANQNFQSSGSRHPLSSSNLFVGEIFSGSLAEIRGWSTTLSASKFKQHVLNKNSTVGNTIKSHCDDLVYHFKLNENYSSSSISSSNQIVKIVDASPPISYKDYSLEKTGSFFTSSLIYGFDFIDISRLSLLDNSGLKPNDNNILINPQTSIVGNLNNNNSSVNSLTNNDNGKPKFKTSTKLELYRSPQNFIDNFIIDKLTNFNLEKFYANPINFYSQSYNEFNSFKDEFFKCHPIDSDINKFIRSHENMFNESIMESLKSVVPGRTSFSNNNSFGVEIRPTILEKQKYEHHRHSVESNPNTFTSSISPSPDLSTSEITPHKSGSIEINVTNVSTFEQPKSASINVNVTNTTTYERPKSASLSPLPTLTDSSIPTTKDGTIDYASIANKSYKSVHKNWGTSSSDVQHINFAGGTGSYGTFNTYDIESRFVFNTIGDTEYYSASFGSPTDFTNINNFYNQLQITNGSNSSVKYFNLQHIGPPVMSFTTHNNTKETRFHIGRRMGKTRYMRKVVNFNDIANNEQLILPRNHVTKFSQPFKEQMIDGAQNTNPGFLNVKHEDYSSASFYRVKVTGGESQIYVKGTSNPTKDETDDRIIY